MKRPSVRNAVVAALFIGMSAPPALSEVSPFEGVWHVERRPRPPPGGAPGRPAEVSGPTMPAALAAELDAGDRRVFGRMTPVGQAKFATFDAKLLPANNCKSPGLPSIAMTPNLQVWKVSGGRLSIHHEYFDTRRDIRLNAPPGPPPPPSEAGYATGQIEGDSLVIETTALLPAWGGLARNAPSSDSRVVREIYRLEGPDQLRGEIIIDDPKFLKAPIRLMVALRRAPAGTEIVTFPCDLEASRRHLDE